jgi:hypothetical protein
VPEAVEAPSFDFAAELAKTSETSAAEAETPERSGKLATAPETEVNAYELLKRERFGIHGSVSVGVNSDGGWGTSLELHRQLTPNLTMGLGVSSMSLDSDSLRGWEASLQWRKQMTPDFSLELGISVGRWNWRDEWE